MVKVWQEHSAKRLNEIVNHPAVLPFVKGGATAPLDLSEAVDDPANVLLMAEHGCVFFQQHQPGLYEGHVQVLPSGNVEWATEMLRSALHWMFCRVEVVEIVARSPKGFRSSHALIKAVGGRYEFTVPHGWIFNGKPIPADIFGLRIQDWLNTAPGLDDKGRWFDQRLREEYGRLHLPVPPEITDIPCLRAIGLAYEMCMGSQPEKAVIFYNRWAALAEQPRIGIVSRRPLAINVNDALVILRNDGDFYIAAAGGAWCQSEQSSAGRLAS
jgi:hypothetical protein